MKPPATITASQCQCGHVWVGGNAKYCPSGHAYQFTTHVYVLKPNA